MKNNIKRIVFSIVCAGSGGHIFAAAAPEETWNKVLDGSALIGAVIENDSGEVARLLTKENANVNFQDNDNKENANVNFQDNDNSASLHVAAKNGRLDIMKVLVAFKANLDIQDTVEKTPLFWAADKGYSITAKVLIDAGAAINIQNILGEAPLHAASARCHSKIVKALIDAKANLDIQDNAGQTALDLARKNNDLEIIEILQEEQFLRFNAIKETLDTLYDPESGMSSRAKNSPGSLILQYATTAPEKMWKEEFDGPALIEAAKVGNVGKVSRILAKECLNVNFQDVQGKFPLYKAALMGRLEIVRMLIFAGADVNRQDVYDSVALHAAVISGELTIVKTLITFKANLDIQAHGERTALDLARRYNHLEIIQILEEAQELEQNVREASCKEVSSLFEVPAPKELTYFLTINSF